MRKRFLAFAMATVMTLSMCNFNMTSYAAELDDEITSEVADDASETEDVITESEGNDKQGEECTITYVIEDGENNASNPTTYNGEDIIDLARPTFNNINYSFSGWYLTPECEEGTEITVLTAGLCTDDITLYAGKVWRDGVDLASDYNEFDIQPGESISLTIDFEQFKENHPYMYISEDLKEEDLEYIWYSAYPNEDNADEICYEELTEKTVQAEKTGFYVCRFGNKETGFLAECQFSVNCHNSLMFGDDVTEWTYDIGVKAGETPVLSVDATCNVGAISYQWTRMSDEIYQFVDIDGETASSYTVGADAYGLYRCNISDEYGNVVYADYNIYLDNGLKIDNAYEEFYGYVGDTFVFDPQASCDEGELTYQWSKYVYDDEMEEYYYKAIEGANDSIYELVAEDVSASGNYSCLVADEAGNEKTAFFFLDVSERPREYTNGFYCYYESDPGFVATKGDRVELRVAAGCDEGELHYRWEYNDEEVGCTDDTYVIEAIGGTGYQEYTCFVWDDYGNDKALTFFLDVDNGFSVLSDLSNFYMVEKGSNISLSVEAYCADELTYEWYELIPREITDPETGDVIDYSYESPMDSRLLDTITGNTYDVENIQNEYHCFCRVSDEDSYHAETVEFSIQLKPEIDESKIYIVDNDSNNKLRYVVDALRENGSYDNIEYMDLTGYSFASYIEIVNDMKAKGARIIMDVSAKDGASLASNVGLASAADLDISDADMSHMYDYTKTVGTIDGEIKLFTYENMPIAFCYEPDYIENYIGWNSNVDAVQEKIGTPYKLIKFAEYLANEYNDPAINDALFDAYSDIINTSDKGILATEDYASLENYVNSLQGYRQKTAGAFKLLTYAELSKNIFEYNHFGEGCLYNVCAGPISYYDSRQRYFGISDNCKDDAAVINIVKAMICDKDFLLTLVQDLNVPFAVNYNCADSLLDSIPNDYRKLNLQYKQLGNLIGKNKNLDFDANGFSCSLDDSEFMYVEINEKVDVHVNATCNNGELHYEWYEMIDDEYVVTDNTTDTYTIDAVTKLTTLKCNVYDDYGHQENLSVSIYPRNTITADFEDEGYYTAVKYGDDVLIKMNASCTVGDLHYRWAYYSRIDSEIEYTEWGDADEIIHYTYEGELTDDNTLLIKNIQKSYIVECSVYGDFGGYKYFRHEYNIDNITSNPLENQYIIARKGENVDIEFKETTCSIGELEWNWHLESLEDDEAVGYEKISKQHIRINNIQKNVEFYASAMDEFGNVVQLSGKVELIPEFEADKVYILGYHWGYLDYVFANSPYKDKELVYVNAHVSDALLLKAKEENANVIVVNNDSSYKPSSIEFASLKDLGVTKQDIAKRYSYGEELSLNDTWGACSAKYIYACYDTDIAQEVFGTAAPDDIKQLLVDEATTINTFKQLSEYNYYGLHNIITWGLAEETYLWDIQSCDYQSYLENGDYDPIYDGCFLGYGNDIYLCGLDKNRNINICDSCLTRIKVNEVAVPKYCADNQLVLDIYKSIFDDENMYNYMSFPEFNIVNNKAVIKRLASEYDGTDVLVGGKNIYTALDELLSGLDGGIAEPAEYSITYAIKDEYKNPNNPTTYDGVDYISLFAPIGLEFFEKNIRFEGWSITNPLDGSYQIIGELNPIIERDTTLYPIFGFESGYECFKKKNVETELENGFILDIDVQRDILDNLYYDSETDEYYECYDDGEYYGEIYDAVYIDEDIRKIDKNNIKCYWYYDVSDNDHLYERPLDYIGDKPQLEVFEYGTYTCVFGTEEKGALGSIKYIVKVPSNDLIVQSDDENCKLEVDINETAIMRVKAECKKGDLTYVWSKYNPSTDEYDVIDNVVGDTYELVITSRDDIGKYCCDVTDIYNNTDSVEFWLSKKVSNGFEYKTGSSSYYVSLGDRLELNVEAKCNEGELHYEWYSYDTDTDDYVKVEGDSNTFVFDNIQKQEEYYCRVYDDYANEAEINFMIYIDNKLTATEEVYLYVDKNDSIDLVSDATCENGTLTYEWEAMQYDGYYGHCGNRIELDGDTNKATYHIDNVQEELEMLYSKTYLSDVGDDIYYSCAVRDEYDNYTVTMFRVKLKPTEVDEDKLYVIGQLPLNIVRDESVSDKIIYMPDETIEYVDLLTQKNAKVIYCDKKYRFDTSNDAKFATLGELGVSPDNLYECMGEAYTEDSTTFCFELPVKSYIYYNMDIAQEILGTSNPKEVQELIDTPEKFIEVAKKIKQKNYIPCFDLAELYEAMGGYQAELLDDEEQVRKFGEELYNYSSNRENIDIYSDNDIFAISDRINDRLYDENKWDFLIEIKDGLNYEICSAPVSYYRNIKLCGITRNCLEDEKLLTLAKSILFDEDFLYEKARNSLWKVNNKNVMKKLADIDTNPESQIYKLGGNRNIYGAFDQLYSGTFEDVDIEPTSYNITYVLNGGTNAEDNPTTYTSEDEIALATPTKTGYTFGGWYTDEECTTENKLETIEAGTTEDITLYAKWTAILYKVSYELNGGLNAAGNAKTYTIEDEIELLEPSKLGYTFAGWFTDEECTESNAIEKIAAGTTEDITVYAKWTADEYTITCVLNGGTNAATNPTKFTVADEVVLADATKTGYTFGGWYTDEECTAENKLETIEAGTTEDITLYAKWTAILYKVSYELNGGLNAAGNAKTYTIEDEIELLEPSKLGYTFVGWFTDEECTEANAIEKIAIGSTGEVKVYAKWSTDEYTITYVLNGGTNAATNPAKYTSDDEVVLANPSKTGYTFAGWFTDEECTEANAIEKIAAGTTGDITVYAKWSTDEYTITYVLNGGTNAATNPTKFTVADEVVLAAATKKGYTFAGWYTDKECTESNKIDKIEKGTTEAVTVYAKWTVNTYKITYVLNGGTNASTNPSAYTVEKAVTFANPTRKGYTFGGWYKDSACTTKTTGITVGSTGNVTVYAKWTVNTYKITYVLNSGTNASTNPSTYTIEKTVKFANPTRQNYEFLGWFTSNTFTSSTKITQIAVGSTGDITVYAKWKKKIAAPEITKITSELDGAKLTWKEVGAADMYLIKRYNAKTKKWDSIGTKKAGTSKTNTFIDKTAVGGTTYNYTVTCVATDGKTTESDASKAVSHKFIAAPKMSSAKASTGKITVKWASSKGATKYAVYRKVKGGSWKLIGYTTKTSYVDKKTVKGKTYSYTVQCVDKKNKAVSGMNKNKVVTAKAK